MIIGFHSYIRNTYSSTISTIFWHLCALNAHGKPCNGSTIRSQRSLRLAWAKTHRHHVIDWNQSSIVASSFWEKKMPRSKKKKKKKRKNRNCHCFAVNNCLRRCDATVRFPTRFLSLRRCYTQFCWKLRCSFRFGLRLLPVLIGWRNKNSVFRCQSIRRCRCCYYSRWFVIYTMINW